MRKLFFIATILLLSACGNQTIRPDKVEYKGLDEANYLYLNFDFENAAIAFSQLFDVYHEDRFAIKSADSWVQIRQYQQAQQQLNLVNQKNKPVYQILQSEIFLYTGQLFTAENYFNSISNDISDDLKPKYLRLKADIEFQFHHYLKAALTLIELSTIDAFADVNDTIINYLLQTSEQQLSDALFNQDITELQQGWLEATYIAYSQDPESSRQWKERWGEHPAKAFFLHINNYKNIAVLLPLSGKYKNISNSIRDGMIAALYRNGATQQQLNFYDTGSNGENFSYAWYGAIESGAEFIIGPLLKKSIKQLNELNSSTVPVMLLNELEDDSNPNGFYQFALSPEDEVRNVANRLVAENKKRIMLLAPESEAGRKLAREFEADLLFKDGQVVSYEFYHSSTHDYSREIKQALGISESLVRSRQLQSIISHKISSKPQVRPDVDAIFIIAKPEQARLIKPQLKFYQAENIPVYSTSQILSSTIDRALDKDLNGIKFCQSSFIIDPLSLQGVLNFDVSQIKGDKKFFAFGYDAIAINPRLEWLQTIQNQKIEGMSGYLSIDQRGKLHRELAWAQFKNGKPVLLPPLNLLPSIVD